MSSFISNAFAEYRGTRSPFALSEDAKLRRVMLARPSASFESPRHAEFFGYLRPMNIEKATEEVEDLAKTYERLGVEVLFLDELLSDREKRLAKSLPNLLFPRDIAGVFGRRIFLGNQVYSTRFAEFSLLSRVLHTLYPSDSVIAAPGDPAVTGEFGDWICLSNESILVNIGHRTTLTFVQHFAPLLFEEGFARIALIQLPRILPFAHLDLACNIIPGSKCMVIDPLIESLVVYELSPAGATFLTFAEWCSAAGFEFRTMQGVSGSGDVNFLAVDPRTVVMSGWNKELESVFAERGVRVEHVVLDEVFAGGGKVRCSTLVLEREES